MSPLFPIADNYMMPAISMQYGYNHNCDRCRTCPLQGPCAPQMPHEISSLFRNTTPVAPQEDGSWLFPPESTPRTSSNLFPALIMNQLPHSLSEPAYRTASLNRLPSVRHLCRILSVTGFAGRLPGRHFQSAFSFMFECIISFHLRVHHFLLSSSASFSSYQLQMELSRR